MFKDLILNSEEIQTAIKHGINADCEIYLYSINDCMQIRHETDDKNIYFSAFISGIGSVLYSELDNNDVWLQIAYGTSKFKFRKNFRTSCSETQRKIILPYVSLDTTKEEFLFETRLYVDLNEHLFTEQDLLNAFDDFICVRKFLNV